MSSPILPTAARLLRRTYSTVSNTEVLDHWIKAATNKQLKFAATLHPDHLSDLYVTLPARDGTRKPYVPPTEGQSLGYGHHLVFFHPRTPERDLRPDGTDADFCPPEPFVRRMWAGGKIEWRRPLIIGAKATSVAAMGSVEKKGFDQVSPMVFVQQKIDVRNEGDSEPAVLEERSHVYLAQGVSKKIKFRDVTEMPTPDFSFSFTPSVTTLFRFSALTFNGHYIHLDRKYAQELEGYPERLVHGPLIALMLLEALAFHKPEAYFKSFTYRAVNPIIVDRLVRIHGAWEGSSAVRMWAEDENGVVGMQGRVTFSIESRSLPAQ